MSGKSSFSSGFGSSLASGVGLTSSASSSAQFSDSFAQSTASVAIFVEKTRQNLLFEFVFGRARAVVLL